MVTIENGLSTTVIVLDSGEVDSSYLLTEGRAVHIYNDNKPIQVLEQQTQTTTIRIGVFRLLIQLLQQ
ncbi:MAG: hypothetical protein U5N58_11630 [Actinomycetota bacterium]|nr:hypothetical protein [Actinomycetota bacterium]